MSYTPIPQDAPQPRELYASDMTLRDYFAGQALAGYSARIHTGSPEDWPSYDDLTRWAYEQADAMMKAREK